MTAIPSIQSSAQSTEAEIIRLSADKYRWYTEKKIDKVEELYDDGLVFIHLTGHVSGKKEWIGEMRSGRFAYNQIMVKEASAKVYDTTAVLVGKAVAEPGNWSTFTRVRISCR